MYLLQQIMSHIYKFTTRRNITVIWFNYEKYKKDLTRNLWRISLLMCYKLSDFKLHFLFRFISVKKGFTLLWILYWIVYTYQCIYYTEFFNSRLYNSYNIKKLRSPCMLTRCWFSHCCTGTSCLCWHFTGKQKSGYENLTHLNKHFAPCTTLLLFYCTIMNCGTVIICLR